MKKNNLFRFSAVITIFTIFFLVFLKFDLIKNIFAYEVGQSEDSGPASSSSAGPSSGQKMAGQDLNGSGTLPAEKSSLPDFTNDGWKKVSELPPDEKVLELSPELIPGREDEIYAQLSSGAIGPRHISNMIRIFGKTKDEKIRYRIIEGLANLETKDSEHALREIFNGSRESERNQIIGRLNPTKDEKSHEFLIAAANGNQVETGAAIAALASAHLFSGSPEYLQKTLSSLNPKTLETYLKTKNKIEDFDWNEHNHNEHIKKEQL